MMKLASDLYLSSPPVFLQYHMPNVHNTAGSTFANSNGDLPEISGGVHNTTTFFGHNPSPSDQALSHYPMPPQTSINYENLASISAELRFPHGHWGPTAYSTPIEFTTTINPHEQMSGYGISRFSGELDVPQAQNRLAKRSLTFVTQSAKPPKMVKISDTPTSSAAHRMEAQSANGAEETLSSGTLNSSVEDDSEERSMGDPNKAKRLAKLEIDISPYLILPQKEAAKRLKMPVSTLSKRWKDATDNRKWPYRTITKIDRHIMAIFNASEGADNLSQEDKETIRQLIKKRVECLKPVVLRI